MKAHYYTQTDPLRHNGIKYLFIPGKKVVIAIGPIYGKLIIKDLLQGHFNTQDNAIDYEQKVIENADDQNRQGRYVEYKGEIKLSKQL